VTFAAIYSTSWNVARILARNTILLHDPERVNVVIDITSAREACGGYVVRAWSGIATDEGVGLICLVEVGDAGRVVCRFEEFLPAGLRHKDWPSGDTEAALMLQKVAVERARRAVAEGMLASLHGHRFEARQEA
jgi:hypothetical protein